MKTLLSSLTLVASFSLVSVALTGCGSDAIAIGETPSAIHGQDSEPSQNEPSEDQQPDQGPQCPIGMRAPCGAGERMVIEKDANGCSHMRCEADASSVHALDESGDGSTISANVADSVELTLGANGSTGYQWSVVQDGGLAAPTGKYVVGSPAPGSSGSLVLTWKPLTSGQHTVKLGYARSWETNPPIRTFEFTVDVAP